MEILMWCSKAVLLHFHPPGNGTIYFPAIVSMYLPLHNRLPCSRASITYIHIFLWLHLHRFSWYLFQEATAIIQTIFPGPCKMKGEKAITNFKRAPTGKAIPPLRR